jgi:hypothetical protein
MRWSKVTIDASNRAAIASIGSAKRQIEPADIGMREPGVRRLDIAILGALSTVRGAR